MSSAKFAAWLRVYPSPTTIAESSAIFKHLKTQAQGQGQSRVTTFIRAQTGGLKDIRQEPNTTSYYAVFTQQPPSQHLTFEVPVYHKLPNPRDLDPFNIRGLQDRKPFPEPKTFTCRLENIPEDEARAYGEQIKKDNPYHGSFKVAYQDWLQDVYGETGAPPGVKQGLGLVLSDDEAVREAGAAVQRDQKLVRSDRPVTERKIRMDSLMDAWYEAMGVEKPQKGQKSGSVARAQKGGDDG